VALNVLVVDDSKVARAIIAKTLKLTGAPVGEILEAANGQEGLAVLSQRWIDLVFADLNMPVMNGADMIAKMNADECFSKTPVIVVSSEGNQTRLESLKKKGVRSCIRKPFTPEALKHVLVELLGADYGGAALLEARRPKTRPPASS
jgi:two-component system, chemotaxis family, chemotaxis protein CheY